MMCPESQTSVNTHLGLRFMTESLWKIVAYKDRFQSRYGSAFPS
jgi:hypothetical protein